MARNRNRGPNMFPMGEIIGRVRRVGEKALANTSEHQLMPAHKRSRVHTRDLVCTQEIPCVYTQEILCENTILRQHRCAGCWAPNPAQHPAPPGSRRML